MELITAIALAALMLGFAAQLIVDQRNQFVRDRARSDVSQTLRSAMDLVGNDIRQAGQYVYENYLPVVSVQDNTSPTPGQVLTVQQKLTQVRLSLCKPIVGTQLVVIDATASSSSCDDTPANIDSYTRWKNFRCNQDEEKATPVCTRTTSLGNASQCVQNGGSDNACLWAYIYDPDTTRNPNQLGDFFLTDFEQQVGNNYVLNRLDGSGWPSGNTYQNINPPPTIYILQEHEYRLVPDLQTARGDDYALQMIVNRQTANPQRLVSGLSNFQVQVQLSGGPAVLPFNVVGGSPKAVTDWKPIQQLQLTLQAVNFPNTPSNQTNPGGIKIPTDNLTLVSQFLPRNALSIPR